MSERTEQLNVHLTDLEVARVDRAVVGAGHGRSAWVRETLIAATEVCPLCDEPLVGRARPKKTREEQLHTRLSETDMAKITRAAARAGKSRAEWVRETLLAATDWCPLCGAKQ